jgi:hypothetical protein
VTVFHFQACERGMMGSVSALPGILRSRTGGVIAV